MKERRPFRSQLSPEYLLLGMLALAPSHGYDLHQQIERDLRYVWSLSLSQVYNVLTRLEKRGMIRGEIHEQDQRPDRKCFQLTPEGERHFQEWLEKPIRASVHAVRIAFLSKLYFGQQLPGVDLQVLVNDQRAAIERGLARLEARKKDLQETNPIHKQSLQLRKMQLQTLLTWLAECQEAWITH
jgi:DNA-binding PadR family transcriptional regulator